MMGSPDCFQTTVFVWVIFTKLPRSSPEKRNRLRLNLPNSARYSYFPFPSLQMCEVSRPIKIGRLTPRVVCFQLRYSPWETVSV
jgi:hypothetical protein